MNKKSSRLLIYLISLGFILLTRNSLAISSSSAANIGPRSEVILARGTPQTLRRILDEFRPRRFNVGNTQLSLSRNGLRHILVRHHPDFWDGSVRRKQTFFRRGTTVSEIENLVEAVINQNRNKLSQLGAGTDTFRGEVNKVIYVLKIERGQIRSIYPE
jgi:hypothetical protein